MPRNRRGRSDARAASRDEATFAKIESATDAVLNITQELTLGEAGAANEVYDSPVEQRQHGISEKERKKSALFVRH